jgi:hypothetical protein
MFVAVALSNHVRNWLYEVGLESAPIAVLRLRSQRRSNSNTSLSSPSFIRRWPFFFYQKPSVCPPAFEGGVGEVIAVLLAPALASVSAHARAVSNQSPRTDEYGKQLCHSQTRRPDNVLRLNSGGEVFARLSTG